ncbi:MAG: hypothetical protein JSR87_09290 [Proteobacteria bacterium]|nr:hypothetical protein [Pseudomonadota bacterium]
MKIRNLRMAAGLAGVLLAGPAWPDSLVDAILADLTHQGYVDVEVSRTLLGRTRIVTHNRAFDREIIVNPATGEILRDYWQPRAGGAAASGSVPEPLDATEPDDNSSSGSNSGKGSSSSGSNGSGSTPGGSGGSSGGSGSGSGGSGGSGSGGSGSGGSGHGGSGGGSGGGGSDDG